MASTDTDVANIALDHLGLPRISDIDDTNNNSAIKCKFHFDDSRKLYLREAAPAFARKEKALAIEAGETLPSEKYDYVYEYPSDCLGVREIWNTAGKDAPAIIFEIGAHSNKISKTILTDQEDAILIYTTDIENLNMFSHDDIEALAYLLAWKVAMPLTRKRELRIEMQQNFNISLALAKKNNMKTQNVKLKKLTRYKDARRGVTE